MASNNLKGGERYRAGLPTLGARLLAAANAVRPGRPAADIGCDHGKLAVWLALRGISPRVIAVDSRPLPLAKARALAAQTGCADVVACRLGDGLAALAPGEAQEIIIAGLSGETIIALLDACAWVRSPDMHLVLVPASRHERLRRWLCTAGFAIDDETPVAEKGRVYTVLSVSYTGVPTSPGPLFYLLGQLPASPDKAAAASYIAARLRNLKKQAAAPLPEAERAAHLQLVKEVEACLQSLQ
ncbi:MAG: SAM-dependent methyltransferase [Ruminococcaceae bacterium]|nr:SAM-dependent methyltransferase [Oscillospiraceae bacterium]